MKIFYFHVPKTAGSSINKFFSKNISPYFFHIEGVDDLNKDFCYKYKFLSGHVSYSRMSKIINLNEWITLASFREPFSYVISHLKWVRKLADKGEEKRLKQHPKIFQDIALKMKNYDFSNINDVEKFIQWLDKINFKYFYNTQVLYMNQNIDQKNITDKDINIAIENMKNIDFIGIQEELDDFMDILAYEFSWEIDKKPRENVNDNNYGFDINDYRLKEVLLPLYEKDMIIYNEAKKIFGELKKRYEKDSQNLMGYIDLCNEKQVKGWACFKDSYKKPILELKNNDNNILLETIPNIYREGLKKKKIHHTGLCEFNFDIKKDINPKNCKVCLKGTEICLPFSKNNKKENHE